MEQKFSLYVILIISITNEKSVVTPELTSPPDLTKIMKIEYPIKLRAAFYYSASMKTNKPPDLNLMSYYRDVYLKTSHNFAWHNIMFMVTHEFTGEYVDRNADIEGEFETFKNYISSKEEPFADTHILLRNQKDNTMDGYSETVGLGSFGGIGSVHASIVVEVGRAVSWSPRHAGNVIAHEIGHNMFLEHSDNKDECICAYILKYCTMNSALYNLEKYQSTFDSCSVNKIKQLRLDVIISNKFTEKNIFEICGNGIVEGNEKCDCGTAEICKLRGEESFCDWKTCNLNVVPNKIVACSSGGCCKDGSIVLAGTKCLISSSNECVYDSYCNGESSDCAILIKPDGSNCSTGTGRCMRGVCITEVTNCDFFYPFLKLGVEDYCYTLNYVRRQEYYENCKYPFCYRPGIISSNAFPYYAFQNMCFSRYDIKSNNLPAIDGTPCAPNKMCVNSKCSLNSDFNKCKNVVCPPESVCVRDGSCKFLNGKIYTSIFFTVIFLCNLVVGILFYGRGIIYNRGIRIYKKKYMVEIKQEMK